jgi:hypothetical protein
MFSGVLAGVEVAIGGGVDRLASLGSAQRHFCSGETA